MIKHALDVILPAFMLACLLCAASVYAGENEACCFSGGTCQDFPPAVCAALGGSSLGPGSECPSATCTGACCLPGEFCSEFDAVTCIAAGGAFQGEGSTCESSICIQACCFADDTCQDIDSIACINLGGTPQGKGTDCENFSCSAACCFSDSSCQDLPTAECQAMGGVSPGPETSCATASCNGVCCFPDGICGVTTRGTCDSSGGEFFGPGSTCAQVVCKDPACPGEGSCCEANGTPGCDDADCCSVVCDFDPTCCEIEWDESCTIEAQVEADLCECAQIACCFEDGSCEQQSFGACLEAGGLSSGPGSTCRAVSCPQPAPENDNCISRQVITDGETQFSNLSATDDGPGACGGVLGSDIWYNYTATCSGDATFTTCEQANYDTVIAVYLGCECPATVNNLLGCNDDNPDAGCFDTTSKLTIDVTEGQCYKIQLGGFLGDEGEGTLTITCDAVAACPAQCTGDINGDGAVDGADLGLLLSAFGDCPPGKSCCEDLNSDEIVDGADLGQLLATFGACN